MKLILALMAATTITMMASSFPASAAGGGGASHSGAVQHGYCTTAADSKAASDAGTGDDKQSQPAKESGAESTTPRACLSGAVSAPDARPQKKT